MAARWLGACALGFLSLTAHADQAFDAFMARSQGNNTTIRFASNGTPIGTSSAPTGVPGYRGMGITGSGSNLSFESLGKLKGPGGYEVPVRSKVALSAAALGKGLFRGAIAAATVGAGVFFTGKELFDIWSDLGYEVGPSGQVGVNASTDPQVVPLPTGTIFWKSDGSLGTWWGPTGQAVCSEYAARYNALGGGSQTATYNGAGGCVFSSIGSYPISASACALGALNLGTGACVAPAPVAFSPILEQRFLEEMPSLSGWDKASEALRQALAYNEGRQAILEEMAGAPASVTFPNPPGPDVVEKPVGQPKVSQKNSTNSQGQPIVEQKTEQTKAKAEGNTVSYTTINITNIYNEATDTTETTTEEAEEKPEDKCKDGDTSLGCSEFGEPPVDDVPKAERSISFVPESLFGGGSCPAWPTWTDSLGDHELDLSQYCSLAESVIRPLLLAMAVLAAIFIVVPMGGSKE